MVTWRRGVLLSILVCWLWVLSCGGSDTPDETASSTTTPVEATAEPASQPASPASPPDATSAIEPDGDRIRDYVRDLAEEMGPRVGGAASERAAADYLAERLRSFGYDVSLQDFAVSDDAGRDSTLTVGSSASETVPSVPFQGSAAGSAKGRLIAVPGTGEAKDFPSSTRGAIALIERGVLQFREKVANARSAGAVGVIIYNHESGMFYGNLGDNASLPAISVSQTEGQRLRTLAERSAVDAEVSVETLSRSVSYNVIAKPPGQECTTVSGGHYDSVPQAPGANDNASGTAVALELASILAETGQMGSNCFVLFGSEELGLLGSRAYVASLDSTARNRVKAMLNFDMVGVGENDWQLIGSAALQERAQALAGTLGIPVARSGTAATGSGSDHASFIQAGIPALFLHRTNDSAWHTPDDKLDRIRADLLETAARLGLALLKSLNGGA